jgi:hypothetical protein
MAGFRQIHERAKSKQLKEEETKTYMAMREELARSLVAAQSLQVPEGQNARRHFRVAQVYKLEIDRTYTTLTKEVSPSGFSAVMQNEMKPGQKVAFAISIVRDTDPVSGEAKVISAVKQGQWKILFSIEQISEANRERLESALFDAVLARFK